MSGPHISELVFDVTEEPEGGYSAACLTESIVTQGGTWEELRAMVQHALEGYFFLRRKAANNSIASVRGEGLMM